MREGLCGVWRDARMAWTEFVEQLRSIALRRQRKAAATMDVAALQRHLVAMAACRKRPALRGMEALEDVLDMLTGVVAPLKVWEREILATRVADFSPAMLDGICRSGHRVWVGGAGGGGGGGKGLRFGHGICWGNEWRIWSRCRAAVTERGAGAYPPPLR